MKADDTVTVTDGSWSKKIVDGKIIAAYANRSEIRGQHWTVVEVGCSFPLDEWQPMKWRNDTVIARKDEVVFIHSGFLKFVKPEHVWAHGDVFKNSSGTHIYLQPDRGDVAINLLHAHRGGTPEIQMRGEDVEFLFNINSKL